MPEDVKKMRTEALEARLGEIMVGVRPGAVVSSALMNEAYRIRKELSRRRGDGPGAISVNFEQFVTD